MAISFSAFFFLLDDDIDDILLFLDLIVVIDIGRRRGLFFSPELCFGCRENSLCSIETRDVDTTVERSSFALSRVQSSATPLLARQMKRDLLI